MSKCWYCNNELTTGDNPKHFGICNKCYDEMFKSGDTIIRSLTDKITELQKQLEETKQTGSYQVMLMCQKENILLKQQLKEKEKEIRQLDNEKGMLLNNSMKLLKEKDDRLKSQPKEIVEKINGEIYTRMVVECKETKYTDINLILNVILKEYDN